MNLNATKRPNGRLDVSVGNTIVKILSEGTFSHVVAHICIQPRDRDRQTPWVRMFAYHKFSVTLVICCKFFPLYDYM